jgi:cytochrome P450
LCFHPLRNVPGPLLYRATDLAWACSFIRGTLTFDVLAMHEKYGPVVRIRPGELAFASPQATNDIYCARTAGQKDGSLKGGARELSKLRIFYKPSDRVPDSLIVAPFEKHAQLRKLMAPAFSEKAMREQEPLVTTYVDMLISKLRKRADGTTAQNLTKWYNWTTFDIIGDLAFGEPFQCLEKEADHAAITLFANSPNLAAIPVTLKYLGWGMLAPLSLLAIGPAGIGFFKHAKAKMRRRMELGQARPDLIEPFIEKEEEGVLTYDDVQANANLFIFAGSETTASLLGAVTYLLLANPDKLAKLTEEIRSTFSSELQINMKSVQNLSYMLACLNEALRYYPPAPTGFPRVAPAGGAVVDGLYIPEGVGI